MADSQLLAHRRTCTAALCRSLGYLAAAQMISEGRDAVMEVDPSNALAEALGNLVPELRNGKTVAFIAVRSEDATLHG